MTEASSSAGPGPAPAEMDLTPRQQRRLADHGFARPSAYVVKGSRGLIAASLGLDVVLDDAERCPDVIANPAPGRFLAGGIPRHNSRWMAQPLGIGVVRTVDECLVRLGEFETLGRTTASCLMALIQVDVANNGLPSGRLRHHPATVL